MVNGDWIDVSVAFRTGMVHWPDNPPIRITRILDMKHGDACTLSEISMGAHSGTHMDAPVHFLRGGKELDEMPLSAVIGPARVIAIRDPDRIRVEELRPHRIRRGERILFKTRNSARVWKTDVFIKEFVYLSTEAGRYLAARRVRTVGVDYLSVGGYKKNGPEVHRALLKAGIWIIEGLDLSHVRPGEYDLICLPLKIAHSDGAPARAVLRRIPAGT
ncbi:MAG TPA: cyclase family protein [Nitrospiraceae bacterium]|nr:cyclase family protein [Nitrospiraceae bacterium]